MKKERTTKAASEVVPATKANPRTSGDSGGAVVPATVHTGAHLDGGANVRTSEHLDFTEQDAAAAEQIGIWLEGSVSTRLARASHAANEAALRAVEAGYLLLSVRAEVGHGEFENVVAQIGMSRYRAWEFMRMARFTTMLPEDRRTSLVSMGKSKLLALAGADKEVIDLILEEGVESVEGTSVRELQAKLKDMQAKLTNATVERDAATAERDAAVKRLAATKQNRRADEVPVLVADLRAEVSALVEKCRLSLTTFSQVGPELAGLSSNRDAAAWIEPTAGIAFAGLMALFTQLEGLMRQWRDLFDLGQEDVTLLDPAFGATNQEALEIAQQYDRLMRSAEYEKLMRQWQREQERPRGKGRPMDKPQPPKDYQE